jgi:hypothetical protein
MSSKASDLFGIGMGRVKASALYTSGTGNYIPSEDMARILFRVQAGGAGGWASAGNSGGGAGQMIEGWIRVPIGGISWAVGAAGAVSANGSNSTLGKVVAMRGFTPSNLGYGGLGGYASKMIGVVSSTEAEMIIGSSLGGVSGGGGGISSAHGALAGFPFTGSDATLAALMSAYYSHFSNGQGNSSGGDSFYGKGGVNGSAPAAGNYGAGGGAGAAGLGGCIELLDFGA